MIEGRQQGPCKGLGLRLVELGCDFSSWHAFPRERGKGGGRNKPSRATVIGTIGDGKPSIGFTRGFGTCRVSADHGDERVRGADGLCDPAKLDTIARMGGDLYARTTERFSFERPKA